MGLFRIVMRLARNPGTEFADGDDHRGYTLTAPLTPDGMLDETAFRTTGTFYKYRITAVYSSGARSDPYEIGVSHTVSSVRRTWGSIKAMFR